MDLETSLDMTYIVTVLLERPFCMDYVLDARELVKKG
jgi:hypothetical protein